MTAVSALPANMRSKIALVDSPSPVVGPCWEWTGCVNSRGYGCVGVNGKSKLSHRVAYELLVGPIAPGLQIDHLCRNKACCNPVHLEPVTGKVNCERSERATKTHCVNGHPLFGRNLLVKATRGGHVIRNCRTCQYDAQRRSQDRRALALAATAESRA